MILPKSYYTQHRKTNNQVTAFANPDARWNSSVKLRNLLSLETLQCAQ